MGQYYIGSLVRLSAAFTDLNNNAVSPSVVYIETKDPKSNVVQQPVTQDSVGNYHADIYLGVSGQWAYRIVGTGTYEAAYENVLTVLPTVFVVPP